MCHNHKMKKSKNIETIFCIGLVILIFVILQAAAYFSTGTFIWCSGYESGCAHHYVYGFLKFLYFMSAYVVLINVFSRSRKWATRIQSYYIQNAKKSLFNQPEQFEGKFFLTIVRLGVVFASFVLLLMGYSILFGPVVLN